VFFGADLGVVEGLFDNGNRECVWEKLEQILGHIKG